MKVAVVHYWWVSNRGGEAVAAAILESYPDADLYIHVGDEPLIRKTLGAGFKGRIITSFISRLPWGFRYYQRYMPLMPLALEQWDLNAYDLVISSEAGPAKGIITRPDAVHICYCHSPMRYIWDMYHLYLGQSGWFVRKAFPLIAHWLRVWDRSTADRVDYFIANSAFVASRIAKYYRRSADVIWPPVDVHAFDHQRERGDFYLCLGELVRYKRADLVVDAFNRLGLPLVVIGDGELIADLRKRAGPNIKILGRQPFDVVKDHLERCKAILFPGVEDFGIVPVEAMAAGAPVIAFGRGGVLDTVIDGQTGIFFGRQDVDAVVNAVQQLQNRTIAFDVDDLRHQAERFEKAHFTKKLSDFVESKISER